MTILSTFLESSLNFPSNNPKKTKKFGTVAEKTGVKFELSETQFQKTVRDKIACKTHSK